MTDIKEENNDEEWKKDLRSEFISGMCGDQKEKQRASFQVGYYYQCVAPASLYKYYSDGIRDLDMVRANKMWYSAPCSFNDVFDCDIWIDKDEIFNSVLKIAPDKKRIRAGSPMWKNLRDITFCQIKLLKATFEEHKCTMGISCLSESYDSLLMWAHYASNHRGMCVEYELMEINKQLRFTPVPVIYDNDKVCFRSLNLDNLEPDGNRIFLESITTKSPEWRYEHEWRIIRDENACGDKWDKMKKGAILEMICPSSIILGCAAEEEFEAAVREYCETSKINLYKMEKDARLYRLNKKTVLEYDAKDTL